MTKSKDKKFRDVYAKFFIPTTRKNYLTSLYYSSIVSLLVLVVFYLKNGQLYGEILLYTLLVFLLVFRLSEYHLTKKIIPIISGWYIEEGKFAKWCAIGLLITLILLVYNIIFLPQ